MLDRRNDGRRSHKGGSSEDCRLQRRQERQRRGRRPATVREGNSGTARDAQLDRSEASTHPNAAIPAARQRRKQRDEPPELKLTPTTNTHTREHRGEGGQACHGHQGGKQQGAARANNNCERMKITKPNNDSKARGQGLIPTGEAPLKPLTGYEVASRRISPGTDNNDATLKPLRRALCLKKRDESGPDDRMYANTIYQAWMSYRPCGRPSRDPVIAERKRNHPLPIRSGRCRYASGTKSYPLHPQSPPRCKETRSDKTAIGDEQG